MDKLNELGGTETMHHSCCQARDPGGGVKRQKEAWKVTAAGAGGKWLRKTTGATRANPLTRQSPHLPGRTPAEVPGCFRPTERSARREEESGRQALGG